jgi:hypothetical protein
MDQETSGLEIVPNRLSGLNEALNKRIHKQLRLLQALVVAQQPCRLHPTA